jgi:hypothetical protein
MRITDAMQLIEPMRYYSGRFLFYTALVISAATFVQASTSDLYPQSLSGQAGASAGDAATCEAYGVPLVSCFYGVGIWSAWILTITSTLIDKFLVAEKDTSKKTVHLIVDCSDMPISRFIFFRPTVLVCEPFY